MRKLRFEELKFSCQVVNEESTPVNLKRTAEGKIFWEKRFFFLVFLNAFKALSFLLLLQQELLLLESDLYILGTILSMSSGQNGQLLIFFTYSQLSIIEHFSISTLFVQ